MYIDKDMPCKIKVFNIYKGEQTGNKSFTNKNKLNCFMKNLCISLILIQ